MKKVLSIGIILAMLTLAGCKNSSKDLLLFESRISSSDYAIDNLVTQGDFFAEDLVIIPENNNTGDDSDLTAGASLLVDTTNQEVIYASHVYDKLYPASLTKLLTSLIVLKYGELSDMVTVSYNASHIEESGAKLCGFQEGDVISMEALLNCLLIYSGNDAAVAVADHISGSEEAFVKKMNEEAKRIGAVHSNFVNSNGLHSDDQYTTAYDLYLIFNELLQYDTFQTIINSTSYTANYQDKDGNAKEKTFGSTNLYLKGEAEITEGIEVIGGKTGTTRKAGNCLILLSRDAENREYISLILKAANRDELYSDMTHLLSLTSN